MKKIFKAAWDALKSLSIQEAVTVGIFVGTVCTTIYTLVKKTYDKIKFIKNPSNLTVAEEIISNSSKPLNRPMASADKIIRDSISIGDYDNGIKERKKKVNKKLEKEFPELYKKSKHEKQKPFSKSFDDLLRLEDYGLDKPFSLDGILSNNENNETEENSISSDNKPKRPKTGNKYFDETGMIMSFEDFEKQFEYNEYCKKLKDDYIKNHPEDEFAGYTMDNFRFCKNKDDLFKYSANIRRLLREDKKREANRFGYSF